MAELQALLDENVVKTFFEKKDQDSLRSVFHGLIYCESSDVEEQLKAHQSRLEKIFKPTALQKLVLRLMMQYPNDIGVLCPYLLNYIVLQPGEAIFLGANEPHAYISGNNTTTLLTVVLLAMKYISGPLR